MFVRVDNRRLPAPQLDSHRDDLFRKSSGIDGCLDGTDLAPVFKDFDFAPVPSLDRRHVWRWKQTKRETLIEFLTPSFEDDETLRDLPALGVSAQSLHFLNYLIAGD